MKEVYETVRAVTGIDFIYDVVARRPGDPAAYFADPAKIESDLGWKAQLGPRGDGAQRLGELAGSLSPRLPVSGPSVAYRVRPTKAGRLSRAARSDGRFGVGGGSGRGRRARMRTGWASASSAPPATR